MTQSTSQKNNCSKNKLSKIRKSNGRGSGRWLTRRHYIRGRAGGVDYHMLMISWKNICPEDGFIEEDLVSEINNIPEKEMWRRWLHRRGSSARCRRYFAEEDTWRRWFRRRGTISTASQKRIDGEDSFIEEDPVPGVDGFVEEDPFQRLYQKRICEEDDFVEEDPVPGVDGFLEERRCLQKRTHIQMIISQRILLYRKCTLRRCS